MFVVLALPLFSCSGSKNLIRVGDEVISEVDVAYRSTTSRCYGDTIPAAESITAGLVSNLLEYEVLRSAFNDVPPDPIIQERATVISQTTHDSATLACMIALGDSARYLRLVVRPTLVNPRLHARFASDTLIHAAARDSIQRIYQRLVPRPELFLQYRLDTLRIPKHDPDPFIANVLSRMNVGNLWPSIIETDEDFRIVMLHGVSDSLYQVLALRVAKRSFDVWFRVYVKQHVPLVFYDAELETRIRKRYPTLWWLTTSL